MPFPSETVDRRSTQMVVDVLDAPRLQEAGLFALLRMIGYQRRSVSIEFAAWNVAVLRLRFDVFKNPADEFAISLHWFNQSIDLYENP